MENELLKKRGKKVDVKDKEEKDQVDELYIVPDHLKVCSRTELRCTPERIFHGFDMCAL